MVQNIYLNWFTCAYQYFLTVPWIDLLCDTIIFCILWLVFGPMWIWRILTTTFRSIIYGDLVILYIFKAECIRILALLSSLMNMTSIAGPLCYTLWVLDTELLGGTILKPLHGQVPTIQASHINDFTYAEFFVGVWLRTKA